MYIKISYTFYYNTFSLFCMYKMLIICINLSLFATISFGENRFFNVTRKENGFKK